MRAERGFDFRKLDSKPAHLHLVIDAAQQLNCTILRGNAQESPVL